MPIILTTTHKQRRMEEEARALDQRRKDREARRERELEKMRVRSKAMQDKLMSEERKHSSLRAEEEKKKKERKLRVEREKKEKEEKRKLEKEKKEKEDKLRAQEESEAVSVCMKFSRIYFLLNYIILHALFLLL